MATFDDDDNYVDVDETLDDFVQYFINDFLPYVPAEISADRRKLLKRVTAKNQQIITKWKVFLIFI